MPTDTTASATGQISSSEYTQVPSNIRPALQVVTVTPLVSIIKDISRCQCQLSRTEQNLECIKEKLKNFEELTESLRGSKALTTVVAPLLENIRKERRSLEVKIEQDTRRLTDDWDEALNLFIRVIYQQFDKEMEDNKEMLHREARSIFNTLSETYLNGGRTLVSSSTESNYSLKYPPDVVSLKRSRANSDHDAGVDISDYSHFAKTVSRMQEQLDRQSEKIEFLLHQNKLVKTSSHVERMPSSLR